MASSRFVDISEADVHELLENRHAKNTKKSTKTAVNMLSEFCVQKKNVDLDELLEDSDLDLPNFLKSFYPSIRKTDGERYKITSFLAIRHSLARYLNDKKGINIIKAPEYEEANRVFMSVCADLKREGLADITHHDDISIEDMRKLYSQGSVFNINTPAGLQMKVWFEVQLYLCRRGRENLRQMTKSTFAIGSDDGIEYVYQKSDEQDKNHRILKNIDGHDKINIQCGKVTEGRMCAINGNPMCPVLSFRKYIDKLNDKLDCLWQRPKDREFQENWYCNVAVGTNTLSKMMVRISQLAELSQVYTNHSIRATACTIMCDSGLDRTAIMKVSGHKNAMSLNPYIGRRNAKRQLEEASSSISKATCSAEDSTATVPFTSNSSILHSAMSPTTGTLPPIDKEEPLIKPSFIIEFQDEELQHILDSIDEQSGQLMPLTTSQSLMTQQPGKLLPQNSESLMSQQHMSMSASKTTYNTSNIPTLFNSANNCTINISFNN